MKFSRLWTARFFIFVVLFFNVQCALAFLISPGSYAPGFELQGPIGDGMVRALAILFLMWNVPYAVALSNPLTRRWSFYEAIVMQAIGLVGESVLLTTFPAGHDAIVATTTRFIAFDGFGLIALLIALFVSRPAAAPPAASPTVLAP